MTEGKNKKDLHYRFLVDRNWEVFLRMGLGLEVLKIALLLPLSPLRLHGCRLSARFHDVGPGDGDRRLGVGDGDLDCIKERADILLVRGF